MFEMKKIALAIGLASMASTAAALPVSAGFTTPETQWSDDSAEIVIDRDGSGSISAGDWLLGVVQMTSYPFADPQSGAAYNSFSAFFANEVASVTALPGQTQLCNGQVNLPSCSSFTFKAISSGVGGLQEAINFLTVSGFSFPAFSNPGALTFGADSVAAFFEDEGAQTPVDRKKNIQTGLNQAADGTLKMVLDLPAQGYSWVATGPSNVADFALLPAGRTGGAYNATLKVSGEAFGGWDFEPTVEVTGTLYAPSSGSVKPQDGGWAVNDDTTFTLKPYAVPEPGTLALLGMAVLGFAAARRRG